MLHSIINISESDRVYHYLIEYEPDSRYISSDNTLYYTIQDDKYCFHTTTSLQSYKNYWKYGELTKYTDNIPSRVLLNDIILRFPVYSVEEFDNTNVDYAVNIYTYINGVKITLYSDIINRKSALVKPYKRLVGNDYYEYISFPVIDPFDLCYSDQWAAFRQQEGIGEVNNLNNAGSLLMVSIDPVILQDDIYIRNTDICGGTNSMLIDRNIDDNMHLYAYLVDALHKDITIDALFKFNKEYISFEEYLEETYNIYDSAIQYEIVIKNDTDIFKYDTSEYLTGEDKYKVSFNLDNLQFTDWTEYAGDMNVLITATIAVQSTANSGEYVPLMIFYSNTIPVNQKMFSLLIQNELSDDKINLDTIDMNVYNINAINQVVNNVVQVERPTTYKSNIIMPVFFKVQDANNIVIHTAVTENIAIRLDAYKSKVSTFKLQIDGVNFVEQGRTSDGIIFEVVGSKLGSSNTTGTYYILDENNVMVTSGKYTAE